MSPDPSNRESPLDRDPLRLATLAQAVLVPLYVAAEFLDILDLYPWLELGTLTLEWTTLVALAFAAVVFADAARTVLRGGLAVQPVVEGVLALLTGSVAVSGLVQLNRPDPGGLYVTGLFVALLAVALAAVVLVGWVVDRVQWSSPGLLYAANR